MKTPEKVFVSVPTRIHVTLLAMDSPIYRINGGIGFALDLWNYQTESKATKKIEITDERIQGLSDLDKGRITQTLHDTRIKHQLPHGISLKITNGPPRHVGLGSGTALTLAAIESYLTLANISVSREELISLSRRGGTSGIGVQTYFTGGFILDGGHKYRGQIHVPSRANEINAIAPMTIARLDMPPWKFGVYLPENTHTLSGNEEKEFFTKTCPITHGEAASATYHALFGSYCSVFDHNQDGFCRSINEIQATKWKSEEIRVRGESFSSFFDRLSHVTNMIGLSSLGPLLYFMSDDMSHTQRFIESEFAGGKFAIATPNNCGRILYRA